MSYPRKHGHPATTCYLGIGGVSSPSVLIRAQSRVCLPRMSQPQQHPPPLGCGSGAQQRTTPYATDHIRTRSRLRTIGMMRGEIWTPPFSSEPTHRPGGLSSKPSPCPPIPHPRTALKQRPKAVSAGGDVRRRPSRSRPCLRAVPRGKASTRRYDVMGRTIIPLDAELM